MHKCEARNSQHGSKKDQHWLIDLIRCPTRLELLFLGTVFMTALSPPQEPDRLLTGSMTQTMTQTELPAMKTTAA